MVQAPDDADVLIAITSVKIAKGNPAKRVSIVARDTDITAILLQRMGDTKNLKLVQPQPGQEDEKKFKVIDLNKFRRKQTKTDRKRSIHQQQM